MTYTAEILGSTIIALGDFNPAIFTPDWLEENQLIGKNDADAARKSGPDRSLLVSHRATIVETKWFRLQVLENQFSLLSNDALSPAFKDLAVGIFQLLPHTPVTAVGLNFMAHFRLASTEEYHKVGDVLAPKTIWNTLFPGEAAGLNNLTIMLQAGARSEPVETKNHKRFSIQPSATIKSGVYMAYNFHHDTSRRNDDNVTSGQRTANLIDREWEQSWKDSVRLFDELLSIALKS